MSIIKNQSSKEENVKFFLKEFAKFLKNNMSNYFGFIDDIQIEVTLKKQDEKQK